MATFASRPTENQDPWYATREAYDQSLEDAIEANESALAGKLDTSAAPELIRDTMGTALVAGDNITITPDDGADTITIAASGGGGLASVPGVGWKSTYYKGTEDTIGATGIGTRAASTLNRIYMSPFIINEPVTVDRIGIEITSASTAGHMRLGIFTYDWPSNTATLVLDAGEVLTTATGVVEATISQALTVGTYWLGFNIDEACTVRALTGESRGMGQSSPTGIAPATWLFKSSVTYGPFASSYVSFSGTAGTPPRMMLRRA